MGALATTFGIDWHLLIAQVANFAILVVVLTWLLYKPVLKMVQERERVIAKGVADAEESTERLARADSEAGKRVGAAEEEAGSIVERARHAATDERTKILKEAEERALRVALDADARAKEAMAHSLRESEKEVARLAILAAEKIMQEKV
ncbi:MAG: F0F1 ATP synthase subunit B [Patescibacteria group bacterium]